tara:strand:- start:15715 stop:16095 length:381 start_codon:yes stop_codon:yes gene_type:complete
LIVGLKHNDHFQSPPRHRQEAQVTLTPKERKQFRSIAHHLKPIVTVADKGLTANVVAELSRALQDHELIKVKVVGHRDHRSKVVADLCLQTPAELVQQIGGVATLFRASATPDARLSNLIRHEIQK